MTADFAFGRTPTLRLCADGKEAVPDYPKHDGYVGEMGYLVECVRTGQRPQRVTAEDAVAGLQIAEAERRSILSGQPESV